MITVYTVTMTKHGFLRDRTDTYLVRAAGLEELPLRIRRQCFSHRRLNLTVDVRGEDMAGTVTQSGRLIASFKYTVGGDA